MYTPTVEEMVAFCGAEVTERYEKDFDYTYSGEKIEKEEYYRTIRLNRIGGIIMLNSPYGPSDEIGETFQLEMARHCPEFLVGKFGVTEHGYHAHGYVVREGLGNYKHKIGVSGYGQESSLRHAVYYCSKKCSCNDEGYYCYCADNLEDSVLYFGMEEDCASYAYRLVLCWLKQQEENNV